jgi:hypothetical protein
MAVLTTPGYDLNPAPSKVALQTNYITNFNFLNQYLPDTYEKEFERYGNRTVSGFLRMVGAEMPTNSDLIKWAEQGRLHTKYTSCVANTTPSGPNAHAFTVTLPAGVSTAALRVGQTVMISANAGASTLSNKAVVTTGSSTPSGPGGTFTFSVKYYEATQNFPQNTTCTVFVYGSEFAKGTDTMVGSLEAQDNFFENKPIILKDTYSVNGSDMAQIGWVEVTTENGATGYLWYLKSEHETRLRFDDYLETSMIEAVPAAVGSGAAVDLGVPNATVGSAQGAGSDGIFYVVNTRGNVFQGIPTTLAEFDTIIQRLDKQGSIEENVIFVNRDFSFAIDDMLAAQNSYGAGGTSYGLFDNDEEMALNLGFRGFRRGYDFYKSDWKYLNDPTMRGGLNSGKVDGLLVPAGSTTVYDQIMGKNAKRPFLHVRYRASETEDRRYKTWITGSAGGATNSSIDKMQVNFLSERAVCTLGANNFFLFRD